MRNEYRPDLDDLALFVLVARTGSIGAAAQQRRLSQPSASRRISALERQLGVTLLVRSRQGCLLTPEGQAVVGWAETLLASADEFTQAAMTLSRARTASVTVAVSMTIAEHLAPIWVSQLRLEEPDVRVSLAVQNSASVSASVHARDVEVGFIESPQMGHDLRRKRVANDRLVIAVTPAHPWLRPGSEPTTADLARSTLLVRESGSGTRETLERAIARHGATLDDPLVMGSNTALRAAAIAGVAPVVLSELSLASDFDAGHLVEVSVPGLSLDRTLSAVWRRDARLSRAAAVLLRIACANNQNVALSERLRRR